MTIKIFNTLHKKKEDLITIRDDRVSMYVCGPTVYSYPHIGNARAAIIPDILFRLLKSSYKEVIYIRNITDVDDKIFDAAKKENIPFNEISEKFTKIYQNDMSALNILEPTFQPKVTDNIPSIISTIKKILDNGYAYISDEHVIFDTQKYNKYGELSKRSLDEMLDGVRIDVADYKNSPRDFVLWKPSKENQPGWDSPWGYGRPGWHIECTSMIKSIIGDDTTLDIHGGGNDLIFPHHENEIAQGSCMSEIKYCNYWFHNGIVLVNRKKMSKSLGNVILVNDLLKKYSSSTIRLALISAHYRQPLNWMDSTVTEANNLVKKFTSLANSRQLDIGEYDEPSEAINILSDDLNTPEIIKYLSALAKNAKTNDKDMASLIASCNFIGLNILDTSHVKRELPSNINVKKIDQLIKERLAAKKAGDYTKADEIRDKLSSMSIEIKDSKDNTSWQYNPD
ncbi:MAG: cysteine--tRNA ligase [Gammaproteobacteria bacterium]|nr:cysteine--tRNA ligase [Gammaproteobacteria bacterium]|tara:strand:- start:93 stop:1451 length:1359 start_codon:yes stop_codon:yes gene_type:complete